MLAEHPAVSAAVAKPRSWVDHGATTTGRLGFQAAVTALELRFGYQSLEALQGHVAAYAALASNEQYAAAEPFARRAVTLARALLGTLHRETATLISDHALTQIMQRPNRSLPEAVPALREVVRIRGLVMGDAHPETAAARHELATLLHATWVAQGRRNDPALLAESRSLAIRALRDFTADNADGPIRIAALHMLIGDIALHQGEPEVAESRAREILGTWGGFVFYDGKRWQIDGQRLLREALLAQGLREPQIGAAIAEAQRVRGFPGARRPDE